MSQPTHALGHTLDLIVTRSDTDVLDLCIDPPFYSDHSLITCKFSFATQPTRLLKQMTMRNWRKLDIAALSAIVSTRLAGAAGMSAHELSQLYHHVLTGAAGMSAHKLFQLYHHVLTGAAGMSAHELSQLYHHVLTGAAGMSAHELSQLYHHVLTDAVN